jgi:hypothetical protein
MQIFTTKEPTMADWVATAANWPKIVVEAWVPKLFHDYARDNYGPFMGGLLIGPAAYKIISPTIPAFGDIANNVVGMLGGKILGTALDFTKVVVDTFTIRA